MIGERIVKFLEKILKYIGITILLLMIPGALLFVPIGNNIILRNHTSELKNINLNAAYEVLATDSECGKLVGNGNGMQYFSSILIHSEEKLKWENKEKEGVFLMKVNSASFDEFVNGYEFGEYCKNVKSKLKEISDAENYYVLYSFYNAPLDSIWDSDLRVH